MPILAIDVGSTYIKSSVINIEHKTIQNTRAVPTPDFLSKASLNREISMDALAESVKNLIEDSLADFSIEGIVFSVQMHGFMLFDKSGAAVSNYVSWQDMRAIEGDEGKSTAELIKGMVPANLLRENGVNLKNTHSLCPLFCFMRDNKIEGPVRFAMLGDALIKYLTGAFAPIHSTLAASSGMYSLVRRTWNRELLREAGLGNLEMPEVYDGREPAAYYETSLGRIPLYAAVGDHQASVLGTCVDDDFVVLNIGTGGQISYIDKGMQFGEYESRPFFENRTLRAFTQRPSGRSLNVLTDFLLGIGKEIFDCDITESALWERINDLADKAQSRDESGLTVDMSFFSSDPAGRGSICGISGSNLQTGNLFCSAYDHMTEEYYRSYIRLMSDGHKKAAGVVCTGGVIRKTPMLMKKIEKRFGIPCRLAPYSDDTMVGLLKLASWHITGEPMLRA